MGGTSHSLPCTLRRYKNTESLCRGKNKCHALALNVQAEKLAAPCVTRIKSNSPTNICNADNETIVIDNHCGDDDGGNNNSEHIRQQPKEDGDNEYLLPNEYNNCIDGGASNVETYECCIRSRRNSRVNDQQNSNSSGTKGNNE